MGQSSIREAERAPELTAIVEPDGHLHRLCAVERRLAALWCALHGADSVELLDALDASARTRLGPAIRALGQLDRAQRLGVLAREVPTRRDEAANARIRAAFAGEGPTLAHLAALAFGSAALRRPSAAEPADASGVGPGAVALMGYLRRAGLRAAE